ncbi:MAG: YihY/virulence factor BrkB family protein [Alkalibacterium sp.]
MFNMEELKKHIPKKEWIVEISTRVREGEIWQHSTFVTYYVLLTLFPLIVGIINVLQQFSRPITGLAWFVHRIAPEPLARQVVEDMLQIYESSNVGVLIVAGISTMWTVSWTMAAILMGLNKAYGVKNRNNIVILRFLAFLLTLVFAAWITFSVFFIQTFSTTSAGRWALFIPLAFITFCLLYYLVPNVTQPFKAVIPGALFSTAALLIAVIGYRLFIYQLPDDSTFFTLTGSFMVLLAILQKLSLAILAGGTVNGTIMRILGEGVTPKDDASKFLKFLRKTGIGKWIESGK